VNTLLNLSNLSSFQQQQVYAYTLPSYKKGNVLQYKANSSNLTQKQRYAQIAKGMWTNRTTTWASQTDAVTMPNVSSLQRVGNTYVSLNPTVYNPQNFVILPSELCSNPDLATAQESNTEYFALNGGSLICTTHVNPCTQQVTQPSQPSISCTPLSASDVPPARPGSGIVNKICWNKGLQTYYPRVRRTYGTSGNKWPTNEKAIFPVTGTGNQGSP
jgi:hypothetical protein